MPSSTTSYELPVFSLGKAKASLTPLRWDRVAQSIADTLQRILDLSKPELLKRLSKFSTFVDHYVHDAARYDQKYRPESSVEMAIHAATLRLARVVCDLSPRSKPPFDANALVAIALAYNELPYLKDVEELLQSQATTLEEELRYATVPTFIWILREPFMEGQTEPSKFLSTRNRTFQMINSILRSGADVILSSLSSRKDFLLAIQYCYEVVLRELGNEDISQMMMETKLGMMDTFHSLVQYLAQNAGTNEKAREQLFDAFLDLVEASSGPPGPYGWFVNVPLVLDYEHTYHLCETLKTKIGGGDGMVDFVITGIQGKMQKYAVSGDDSGGMSILLSQISLHDKGKGKAVQEEAQQEDSRLDMAVSEVLDVFPEEDPTFLRAVLQDPYIDFSTEKLIAALLEGSLPPHLASLTEGPRGLSPPPPAFERRNVFDDEEMDISRIRLGADLSTTADTMLKDKSFAKEMKADIIRRAQEVSSDEESYVEPTQPVRKTKDGREIVFLSDLEDEEMPPKSAFKLAGGDVDSDSGRSDDNEEGTTEPSKPPKVDVDNVLGQAYLRDPQVFERDSSTRRSKARADLRVQTGWGDEQIEGWKIMLDRNPRKDKVLAQYSTSFNKPQNHNVPPPRQAESSDAGRGQQRGRGRVFRGAGRGRGGGPNDGQGQQSARDRAWKEKSKSRVRQGGQDKKAARGGAGP